MAKQEFYGRHIDLQETYYVVYNDMPRTMSKKELEEYNRIKSWPQQMQIEELLKLDPQKNPRVYPVTGAGLIDICLNTYKFPVFDTFFDKPHSNKYVGHSRKVTLLPLESYTFYQEHSKLLQNI